MNQGFTRLITILLCLCLGSLTITAQNFEWQQSYDAASIETVLLPNGNLLHHSRTAGSTSIGNFSGLNGDIVFISDSDGNIMQATGGISQIADIEIDFLGNIFIAGNFSNSLEVNGNILENGNGQDRSFIIRLDNNLNVLWHKISGDDNAATNLIASNNSIIQFGHQLIGNTPGIISIDAASLNIDPLILNTYVLYAAQLDINGNVLGIHNLGYSGSNVEPVVHASAANTNGDLFLGMEVNHNDNGNSFISNSSSTLLRDFVLKTDASFNVQWLTDGGQDTNEGNNGAQITDIEIDPFGNVLVLGYMNHCFDNQNSDVCSSFFLSNIALAYGHPTGFILSLNPASGNSAPGFPAIALNEDPESIFTPHDLESDVFGEIYIAGTYGLTQTSAGPLFFGATTINGANEMQNLNGYGSLLIKLDNSRSLEWLKPVQGITEGFNVEVEFSSGSKYISGKIYDNSYFDNSVLASSAIQNTNGIYLAKLDDCETGLQLEVSANGNCEGGNIELIASQIFGATYNWTGPNGFSSSEQNPIINNVSANNAGVYICNVFINDCNQISRYVEVEIQSGTLLSVINNDPLCSSDPVSLSVSNSDLLNINWNTGENSNTITAISDGYYFYTASTANGCIITTDSVEVTIDFNLKPLVTSNVSPILCNGSSITLSATVPPNVQSLEWNTGETSTNIDVDTPGTYFVTAVYNDGCVGISNNFNVADDSSTAIEVDIVGSLNLCPGDSVTLVSSSADNNLWSTGDTTQTITISENIAGVTLTVSNDNGCSAMSNPIDVSLNENIDSSISSTEGTALCDGISTTLSINEPGATGILWINTINQDNFITAQSGSYYATFSTADGCLISSDTIDIVASSIVDPSISFTGNGLICGNQTVELTALPSGLDYTWSTGESGQSINIDSDGIYEVEMFDEIGCSVTVSSISFSTDPTILDASISSSNPNFGCAEDSTILSAATNDAYLWSTGETTSTITVFEPGEYWYTAISNNGCTLNSDTLDLQISSGVSANISVIGSTILCSGESVTLEAEPDLIYDWSTGESSQSIEVGEAGVYTLTVSDAAGCSSQPNSIVISVFDIEAPAVDVQGPLSFCNDTSVILTASYNSDYSFEWNTGNTETQLEITSSGTFYGITTNDIGCTEYSDTIVINAGSALNANISVIGNTILCAGDDVTLVSDPADVYVWSTGSTEQSITVDTSGIYSLSVVDASGCESETVTIEVTDADFILPTISANGPVTFCAGNTVVLTAVVEQGYAYEWNNGNTEQDTIVNSSGIFYLTATDPISGCVGNSDTLIVNVGSPVIPIVTASGPTSFCYGDSVTLSTDPAFAYFWSNESTEQSITVFESGLYSVITVDDFGCSSTSIPIDVEVDSFLNEININGPQDIDPGLIYTYYTLTGDENVEVEWTITGGQIDFADRDTIAVIWDDPQGTLCVEYTSGNDCFTSDSCISVMTTVGIGDELFSDAIQFVPNPANDWFVIQSDAVILSMEIFNLTGQKIALYEDFSGQINVADFDNGIYMVRIVTDKGMFSKKLTVQH